MATSILQLIRLLPPDTSMQLLSWVLLITFHTQAFNAPDDLPKTVARTLNEGSMGMDFHPIQQTLLLVGTNVGDIGLREVGSRDKLVLRNFKVWDLSACSMPMQAALVKDPGVSVNRVIWSPDGSLFGVAYSRHIVQIYSYHGGDDVRQHLEIDAHIGGLCVITCGDDKTIKVWDAATGARQYTFEGHDAPMYSVCPHYKENIQFIFSTALDGKIKTWLYDNMGSRVDYEAPGHWCTTMAYSADGTSFNLTGMAKVTNAYDPPARRVIHTDTVGPKYAVKYLTAPENALSHCYVHVYNSSQKTDFKDWSKILRSKILQSRLTSRYQVQEVIEKGSYDDRCVGPLE